MPAEKCHILEYISLICLTDSWRIYREVSCKIDVGIATIFAAFDRSLQRGSCPVLPKSQGETTWVITGLFSSSIQSKLMAFGPSKSPSPFMVFTSDCILVNSGMSHKFETAFGLLFKCERLIIHPTLTETCSWI